MLHEHREVLFHRGFDCLTQRIVEGFLQGADFTLRELTFHQGFVRVNRDTQTAQIEDQILLGECLGITLGRRFHGIVDRLHELVGHAVLSCRQGRTENHRSQRGLDDVPACFQDFTGFLVFELASEGIDRSKQTRIHRILSFALDHLANVGQHIAGRGFVEVELPRLATPHVVVLVAATFLIEATLVEQAEECLGRGGCTQQEVTEHRAVGHTIDLTHHLHGEAVLACCLGLLVVSQRHQGIEGVELLTARLHTSQQSLLIGCRQGFRAFVHLLLQDSHSRLNLRITHLGIELGQGLHIGLLVRLDAQTFEHTQLEVVQVVHTNRGFPRLAEQHEPMNLAALRVDQVGGDTDTLLLPDRVFKVQGLLQSFFGREDRAAHVIHEVTKLPDQAIVLGLDAGTLGLVGILLGH